MRLIDADALIAEYPDDVLTHCDIEAAPTIELESLRPQWIPVTDRLPEEKQRVLVRCKTVGTTVGWRLWGEWMTDLGDGGSEVTHWMPLPEPYNPEGMEDRNE